MTSTIQTVACSIAVLALMAGGSPLPLAAQSPAAWRAKDVKYVRDSEEYATLVRQIYRWATAAVDEARRGVRDTVPWAVVLDVDETALDNSVFELEREAYGVPFDDENWNAYVARRASPAVPGVIDFVAAVRRHGGRIAWVTNRDEVTRVDTRENLRHVGLWNDGDRLCLQTTDQAYTKAVRRQELASGTGQCAWAGSPVVIVAFVGDQLGDFPAAGEGGQGGGADPAAFGERSFLLPNPMYGRWLRAVTRRWPWHARP